jgi:16S rRNA (cytosine1402-N4)-methyltransferase
MVEEVSAVLRARSGGRYVDGTVGEGGHAERILADASPDGEVLGLDWDADAIELTAKHLTQSGDRLKVRRTSFAEMGSALQEIGWSEGADGILLDLGVSTLQLGRAARGFSFSAEGPLDMRMDDRRAKTAADLVNTSGEQELADLIYTFGEEKASRRIARSIVRRRQERPFETTGDLRQAVIASGVRTRPGRDPATRTFQALRIAVNGELAELESILTDGWRLLRSGGRMAILTYHSLEDRLVKQAFRRWAARCVCPPGTPVCSCGWKPRVTVLTRKRLRATDAEVEANPRARSAGLRAVERLAS